MEFHRLSFASISQTVCLVTRSFELEFHNHLAVTVQSEYAAGCAVPDHDTN